MLGPFAGLHKRTTVKTFQDIFQIRHFKESSIQNSNCNDRLRGSGGDAAERPAPSCARLPNAHGWDPATPGHENSSGEEARCGWKRFRRDRI